VAPRKAKRYSMEKTDGKIFDVSGKSYIHFENITIRNGYTGIKGNDADGIVVKNCTIFDVHYGIISFTKTKNWVIANNHIMGELMTGRIEIE